MVPEDVVDVDDYVPDTSNDERVAWLNQARGGAAAIGEPITIVDSDDEDEKTDLGLAVVLY